MYVKNVRVNGVLMGIVRALMVGRRIKLINIIKIIRIFELIIKIKLKNKILDGK